MRKLKRIGFVALMILIALLVAYSAIGGLLHSDSGRFPVYAASQYPERHIQQLVWPTIGYPALVSPGESVNAELDYHTGSARSQPVLVVDASATLTASRRALSGEGLRLVTKRAWLGPTEHWASDMPGRPKTVWHFEFAVPADALPELYDLTVEAKVGRSRQVVADAQQHAVAVRGSKGDDFTFVSLADIHVHERNSSGFMTPQTDKGITASGVPVYFENAIDEVNLIRPDFVVILGDDVRAQHKPGEYQAEFKQFYDTLTRLQVPAFLIPGNHDTYINEVDGAVMWQQNIGPLYYSFNVGDCHFDAVNSNEWPAGDRIVMKKLGTFVFPEKWQGQLLHAKDEKDPSTFTGELGWLKRDLEKQRAAKLRFVLIHHDPFYPDGEGLAYDNETFAGIYALGGNGKGRTALRTLASTYEVNMVLAGHLHQDQMGVAPWNDGTGETFFADQNAVTYGGGGMSYNYPGYRLLKVTDGQIREYAYVDGIHSTPLYDGTSLKAKNDLDHLDRPAIQAPAVENTVQGSLTLNWTVRNYLETPMEFRGLVAVVPGPPDGYVADGGQIYAVVRIPGDPGKSVFYISTSLGAGAPGVNASTPGTPREVGVRLYKPTP